MATNDYFDIFNYQIMQFNEICFLEIMRLFFKVRQFFSGHYYF